MSPDTPAKPTVRGAVRSWWKDRATTYGPVRAAGMLAGELWGFVRDSTPERRRQCYGDVDYDWDHRVDTTGATIHWRDRLLGVFYSPYQPTDAALFHEMLGSMEDIDDHRELARREQTRTWNAAIDFGQFVFIDLGSGKGRTLLMASEYPFKRIIGVELLPELHRVAQENLSRYSSDSQKCRELAAVCQDARDFEFPQEPILLYLFNPLPRTGLQHVLANLERSVRDNPREVYVLYHNPQLEEVLTKSGAWTKAGGTHQWVVYRNLALGPPS